MSPPQLFSEYARLAEPRLRAFLDERAAALSRLPVDLRTAAALLREYVLRGGKRMRGALVVLGCQAAGGRREDVLDASLGLELIHAYLLIHDDFMDRDPVRRGGPTLHVSLAQTAGEHLGGSVAILLGSLCQAWGTELVLRSPVAADRALRAAAMLVSALQDVTVGQVLDLLAPLGPALPPDGVLEVQRLKTGSYSFELPLRIGASLSGATPEVLGALEAYARPLGQAFQIADDVLGTFGEPGETGKANANDLREGKRTLLVARALEAASREDAAALRAGLGDPELSDARAEELRGILRRTGALEAARAESERLRFRAVAALGDAALPSQVAGTLRAIAEWTVSRAR